MESDANLLELLFDGFMVDLCLFGPPPASSGDEFLSIDGVTKLGNDHFNGESFLDCSCFTYGGGAVARAGWIIVQACPETHET